jgi:branched-chain amino acid transport system permease protein
MSDLLQFLVSGVGQGCIFALLASGFVVIHRVTNVVNMAQGTFAVVGGMMCYSFIAAGLPRGVAEVAAVLLAGLIGVAAGYVTIGRRGLAPLASLIVSFGIVIFAYAVEIAIWGDQPISFDGWTGAFQVGEVRVQKQYILIVGVTMLTFTALEAFFNYTYAGKALTACHMNPYAASLLGIDTLRMGLWSFFIAGVLGGMAGVLIAPIQSVSFDSDVHLALNGFAAAVMGGLLHPRAALIGAIALGIASELVAGYLNAAYKMDVTLALMLAAIAWRMRNRSLEAA